MKKFILTLCLFLLCVLTGCKENLDTNHETEKSSKSKETVVVYMYSNVNAPNIDLERISYIVEEVTSDVIKNSLTNEIMKKYGSSMENSNVQFRLNSIRQEGRKVVVDFAKNSFPIIGAGSQQERDILNTIVLTVKNNLSNVEQIYFQMDGGNYESGHFIYEKDMPYDLDVIMPVE